ncbi:phasin family protein [bacterium]|nr:phasin family protein [bacterium]
MDTMKKVFLAGVGALSLSKDRAQKIVTELIAQGKIREKEGRKLAEEMMRRAESTRKDVEKNIHTQVNTVYTKVNVATQVQLKKMEKRIHELEREVAKKNKPTGPAKKKTAAKSSAKKKSAGK